MNRFLTATEARRKFYALIDEAEHPGMAVAITHEGMPKVVVMSFEEYESWMETLEIMADPELSKDLLKSMKQLKAGTLKTIPYDTLKKKLKL